MFLYIYSHIFGKTIFLRPLISIYATLAIIIATLNVAAFALFGIDKWKARNDG